MKSNKNIYCTEDNDCAIIHNLTQLGLNELNKNTNGMFQITIKEKTLHHCVSFCVWTMSEIKNKHNSGSISTTT